MARVLMSTLAALLMTTTFAGAKTFPVPDENPIATITIPDSWDPSEYEDGIQGTSEDGDVYVAVESVESEDIASATALGIKWFAKQGVQLDMDSKQVVEMTLNGMPALSMVFDGRDDDGPTRIGVTLVKTNSAKRFLLIYGWGSLEAREANGRDIDKIIGSLTATK